MANRLVVLVGDSGKSITLHRRSVNQFPRFIGDYGLSLPLIMNCVMFYGDKLINFTV